MRAPERITYNIKLLERVRNEMPDMRLGQLITNLWMNDWHAEDSVFYQWVCDLMERDERDVFCRGTRWKDGKSPLVYKAISALETDHLIAILETQKQKWVSLKTWALLEKELAMRTKKPCVEKKAPPIESDRWSTKSIDVMELPPEIEFLIDLLTKGYMIRK